MNNWFRFLVLEYFDADGGLLVTKALDSQSLNFDRHHYQNYKDLFDEYLVLLCNLSY
jgi:hypothetical protein